MRKEGKPQREIATAIGFSQLALSKELKRNCGQRGYWQGQAQRLATKRKSLRKSRPRVILGEVREEIEQQLRTKQSPQQISGAMHR